MPPDNNTAADPEAMAQAAEWFALLRSEQVHESDRRRWQAWFDASAAHRMAWERVLSISRRFEHLAGDDGARHALKRVSDRRHALKTLLLLCGAGTAAWAGWRLAPVSEWTADYRTGVGETRRLDLAGGVRVWLNTDSAIDVAGDGERRRLRLLGGEILIDTGAGERASRTPALVVVTDHGRVQPLGTRFRVHDRETESEVAVYAGSVRIMPRTGAAATELAAGRRTRFDHLDVAPITTTSAHEAAWTRGMLVAEDMRLGDFLAELSRYRHGWLRCDPAVADLRLVGAYPLDDTDRVLVALEDSLPVTVERLTPWWVTVRRR